MSDAVRSPRLPTKNRSDLRDSHCGWALKKVVNTIQATYHNPTMAKYKLCDLIKSEWSKGRESCSGADSRSAPELAPEQKHWVETYHPSNRPQYSYYRYVWMQGRKLHRHHIKGSADSPKAKAMMERVERAIATGSTPANIVAMIVKGDGS